MQTWTKIFVSLAVVSYILTIPEILSIDELPPKDLCKKHLLASTASTSSRTSSQEKKKVPTLSPPLAVGKYQFMNNFNLVTSKSSFAYFSLKESGVEIEKSLLEDLTGSVGAYTVKIDSPQWKRGSEWMVMGRITLRF